MTEYKTDLDTLLGELIAAEPSFAAHREELKQLVQRMKRSKPDWRPDAHFVEQLRARLAAVQPSRIHSFFSLFSMNYTKPFLLSGAGALAIAIVAVSVLTVTRTPAEQAVRFALLDAGAFGSLAGAAFPPAATPLPEALSVSEPAQFGGGGFSSKIMADSADARMIVPYPITEVTYTYVGEPISLPETSTVPVYHHRVSDGDAVRLARAITGERLDMLSFSGFDALRVDSIQLKEDKDRGYMVHLNLNSGSASVNVDYSRWPELNCENGCTYREMTRADVPNDASLIAMANAFLAEKGIDRSLYGEPIIDKQWEQHAAGENSYVPTIMNVVYPILLPEGAAHDMSGQPYGLTVGVNIQHNFVDSAYNIFGGTFAGSQYDIEGTPERILSFAEEGGRPFYPWYTREQDVKRVTFELGTPELVYVQHYPTDDLVRIMRPREAGSLFIPALRFPVLGESQPDVYKPPYITVPIVSEILDSYERQNDPGQPVPLPEPLILEEAPEATVREQ